MSLLVIIDGLETSPSSDHGQRDGSLPVLERLAATGQTGRLQLVDGTRRPEDGAPYFKLFGCMTPEHASLQHDLPLGYAVALGLADGAIFPDPKRTWCCLGFTHLYRKQNDLLFLSPERTGQTQDECWDLAKAILPELQEDGWSLGGQASRSLPSSKSTQITLLLSRDASPGNYIVVRTCPLVCSEGASFRQLQPSGPSAQSLLQLLTMGQLCLARHPLNVERQRSGRVALNTPWIWGVGHGMGFSSIPSVAQPGHCWTAHPVVAGLARARGYSVATMDEMADFSHLVAMARTHIISGTVVIHLQWPAILARHGLMEERRVFLQRVNEQLLEPLTQALLGTQKRMLVTSAYSLASQGYGDHRPVPWVAASGRGLSQCKRFWHRGRFGEGETLTMDRFQTMMGEK